jgi:hypothetical protein
MHRERRDAVRNSREYRNKLKWLGDWADGAHPQRGGCLHAQCLALEADTSLGSGRVMRVLERLIAQRGRPENVRSDNGPEFTSRRMLAWSEDWKVGLVHIQPGRTPLPFRPWASKSRLFRMRSRHAIWYIAV